VRKHIQLRCHGPVAVSRRNESPWEDVWLRWRDRPGRPRRLGPVLIGRLDLEEDIEFTKSLIESYPDTQEFRDELVEKELALREVQTGAFAVSGSAKDGSFALYTPAEWITQREAERMIGWYLATHHGIKNPKFKWRRPKYVIIPM
jgi:hypothetical protein